MQWEREGAIHRRDLAGRCQRPGVQLRDPGHSERRHIFGDGRRRRQQGAGGDGPRLDPAPLRRGDARERESARRSSRGAAGRARAAPSRAGEGARIVISYEPVWAIGTGRARHAAAGAGGPVLHPQAVTRLARRGARPTACASSTGAASSPTTSARSWPRATSTARWSAGPACAPIPSSASYTSPRPSAEECAQGEGANRIPARRFKSDGLGFLALLDAISVLALPLTKPVGRARWPLNVRRAARVGLDLPPSLRVALASGRATGPGGTSRAGSCWLACSTRRPPTA
jgi:hypothetical protein